ncbi:MAG: alanyl-tRNA editing protein [Rhodospirillales bacterium]|nr:alanyl-tRNA editing protein [Rhodospirillales bacterium]
MLRKVFWDDPYLRELDTKVNAVEGDLVTLTETIFFAFSGGQESDTGRIGGCPVLDARTHDGDILYTLPDDHGLAPGDPVHLEIDWARRYRLMRLHFAAEIVLELVYKHLPGIEKIGAHIAQDKARIDFAMDENINNHFDLLSGEANRIVDNDMMIERAFSDEAAGRRYWKIEGFGEVPCGGTHVKRTGEVGAISLKRKNIGAGKERIEVFVSE